MKINKMSYSRMRSGFAGHACFCGLVVLLVAALLCPAGWDTSVYADEGDNQDISNNEPTALSNDADAGIDMQAATAGITIGGDAYNKQVTVAPGETGYREHTVQLTGSDISSYTLKISGTPDLTGPNGSTTVTGAGGKTPDAMADDTWGYAWGATGTAKESMSYQSVTTAGTALTADAISGTTLNSTRKLAFAAKFGASNIAGRYTGTVTLSMVATPTATVRTLTYNGNNGTPASQTLTCDDYGTGCNITSSYTTPTRSGYNFLGWADSSSSATSKNANYDSGKTISMSGNKTIYAVWQSQDPWGSITTMQQMTSSACAAASTGKSKTLTDSRDSSTYTVRKMEDGKCWMTSNLKIVNKTISSSDSDMTSGSFTIPASSTSGFSDNAASNAYVSGSTGYYTWCAATAGTCSSATSDGANASSSICPKGWKLPTGGTGKSTDFWLLFRNMGLTISNDSLASSLNGYTNWGSGDLAKVQGSPYNFAYTGRMSNGSMGNTSDGYWWSRTAYDRFNAYILYIDSSNVYPGTTSGGRSYGFAVRCVAQ